jgi:hypothetical protein
MRLPLVIGDQYICGVRIADADGLPIGNFSDDEWGRIVSLVNAHDGLVAALSAYQAEHSRYMIHGPCQCDICKQTRRLLAAAGEA